MTIRAILQVDTSRN